MATLAQLRAEIATELNRSDLSARIESAVSEAIEAYQTVRFAFNEATDTFSTAAGTEEYGTPTIPDDIGEIDSVRISAGGLTYDLRPTPWAWFERNSLTPTTQGRPTRWTWYAQKIRLYPVPDAIYTVTLSYLQKIPEPAASGDSNAWTTVANEMIRHSAKRRLCAIELRDPEGAAIYEREETRARNRLLRDARLKHVGPLLGSM